MQKQKNDISYHPTYSFYLLYILSVLHPLMGCNLCEAQLISCFHEFLNIF